MWKEINSQLGVFLNIMNITGPSVYKGRTWFTLLHMAEAPLWTLEPLHRPNSRQLFPGSDPRTWTLKIVWRPVTQYVFFTVGVSKVFCVKLEKNKKKTTSLYETFPCLLPLTLLPADKAA